HCVIHQGDYVLYVDGLICQPLPDAYDTGSRASMRRGPQLDGFDHAREVRIHVLFRITGDFERPVHDIRTMVPDRTARQFITVAHDVVLPGLDRQRILVLQRLHLALRHGEGIVAEVDLLLLLVVLEHREIDDPAEPEAVLRNEVEFFAHPGSSQAG